MSCSAGAAHAPHAVSLPLVLAVQGNCDIADARHAAERTLCNATVRTQTRWSADDKPAGSRPSSRS